jgi:hypothetical protein
MFNPVVSNIGGSGRVESIDYVNPSSSVTVAAGSVVIVNGVAYFAAADIPPLALGSLVFSGGVWAGSKASGGWTLGQAIYWNPTGTPNVGTASSGAFENTPGSSKTFVGFCVLSPATGIAAATADQYGTFVKSNAAGSGLRAVAGQTTTVTASDTVVTGLNTVVAVVASLDSAPVLTCAQASASIGDQAGTPAAGSVLIQTWMPTDSTHPTLIAATTFSKKVNWVAYGY